jgi:hypothetical protein
MAPHSYPLDRYPETDFLNFYDAQESIPSHQFRQAVYPGGPVQQPYSYSVLSPHRLFNNSSTGRHSLIFRIYRICTKLQYTFTHQVRLYKEYHSVCPILVGIGTLPIPNSDDLRKSLALCLLCAFTIAHKHWSEITCL